MFDIFIWYNNYKGDFVKIPIEVKSTNKLDKKELDQKSEKLKEFGAKKLLVVANTENLEMNENYSIIPIELFLLLL